MKSVLSVMDDRFAYGFDAGNIVDGTVSVDPDSGEIFLLDEEDGSKFFPKEALSSLIGKKVRMTVVSFEAMEAMEAMHGAGIGGSL